MLGLPRLARAADPDRAMSQYLRDHFSIEQGFPGGAISSFAQTPDGYLWIGTEKGLVRFDGVSFRLIEPADSQAPPVTYVLGLTVDGHGNLWVREQWASVRKYHHGTFENAMTSLAEPEAGVTAMSTAQNGDVLLAGLIYGTMRNTGNHMQAIATRDQVGRSPVMAMAETRDGTIWMGTREAGLFALRASGVVAISKGLPDSKINCVLPLGDHEILVGTDSGIVRWNGSELTSAGLPTFPAHVQALAMIKDREANVWIGTSTGLLRLNAAGLASFSDRSPRSIAPVTAVFEDREGNIWTGGSLGIERLRDGVFTTYSTTDGIPSDNNGSVYVDALGRTWSAPLDGGLFWLKGGLTERVTLAGLAKDVVYSIDGNTTNGRSDIWIGRQRGGLTHLRETRDTANTGSAFIAETLTQANGLPQNSVYAVHVARDGAVWAGTLSGGVSRFKDGHFTTYTSADGLVSNTVSAIVEGLDGTMWFGTPSGLSAFSQGRWRAYTTAEGLPSENINCLLEDTSGVLWIGTPNGLAFLTHHAERALRAAGPSPLHESILGIAAGKRGSLWMTTPNRVLRVRRDAVLRGEITEEANSHEYGLPDGLRGVEGVRRDRSVIADPYGRIWLSMNRGLSMVDPPRADRNSVPALVNIQGIAADGKAIDLGKSDDAAGLRVPSGRQRLTFSFAGLSLSVPDRVRFRYRLDGFDHEWREPITARSAVYTNLGPGTYRFRVRASNSDGLWSDAEATLGFSVQPAFWETWWFQFSWVAIGLSIVWAIAQLRLRRYERQLHVRFEERLAERTRIAQELHDTLLQGFLSASMQLDVAVDRLPPDSPARPGLTRVIQLMGQVIEEGRNAVRGLRSTNVGGGAADDLERALTRIPQELLDLQQHATDFRVIVEGRARPLHPIIRDEVYRIGREALVNAFRHAEASSIEVELDYAANSLRMLVRDNGRGIDPHVLKSGRDGHWGLSGMRERAERIGARFKVFSRAAAGTEVELSVPGHTAFQAQAPDRSTLWFLKFISRSEHQK